MTDQAAAVRDCITGLRAGDFSRLEPLFIGKPPLIQQWHQRGLLADAPDVVAEALTCACFLGHLDAAEYFLAAGVAPPGGAGTGLDALHWAANRGQLGAVQLLLKHGASLETRSHYDGTVLGTATWSARNEPRAEHLAIIEALLHAGARIEEAGYPTGLTNLDALLRRHGAV